MNFTLHLTDACNLDCAYCPAVKQPRRMSEEILYAACDLAFAVGAGGGFCYFGGEPMLERELILKGLERCKELSEKLHKKTSSRMTTNGTLLDGKFLDKLNEYGTVIGLSFDGVAQDKCRRNKAGGGTFRTVAKNARLLHKKMPMSYAMMTISPQAVGNYADSVKYLYELGFRRVIATIAYGQKVNWTDEALEQLRGELEKTAGFYSKVFATGERFYFSPFDTKISGCIKDRSTADHCHLGFRQMPIDTDGKIYPCTQFIGLPEYCLGNVFDGIDREKQLELSKRAATPEECRDCALIRRCVNSCGCANRLQTGDENKVSPLQCTYERMLIEIADGLAERLCRDYPEKFAKKFG